MQFGYCVIFPIGLLRNTSESKRLEEENNVFGDILQGDYVDSYRNLSLKSLSALRYIAVAYPKVKAILKMDDDVAWNVPKVANYINYILPRSISCHKYESDPPIRDKTSKWFTAYSEYPEEKFPQYCNGAAYILHGTALQPMFRKVTKLRFFWIDDVFITGLLAHDADIHFVKINQYIKLKKLHKPPSTIFYDDMMFYGTKKESIGYKFVKRVR
ncbi:unnamed protein product [Strongylus vulgaris]|uniref:Hexosyltransferase n=1 Tax=Strongylus vulgaris TaxID=40348 RepID=A0A3P7KGP8_STRVU|nr:unnamed protein product [Strongylus vulgaris]